jgi:2-oxoisovalerate dehydrogenase E1 component
MSTNRVAVVESKLDAYLASAQAASKRLGPEDPLRPGSTLGARQALEIFEDQLLSRALDVASRELKRTNRSFYTISSAGHEDNAVVGALLRLDDPCFLHYRSGGLMMARSRQAHEVTPTFDTLLSFCASSEDPISGGRHKVWGSKRLWVPPQTSTIASHLPKAVGWRSRWRARGARPRERPAGRRHRAVLLRRCQHQPLHALSGFSAARYVKKRGNPCPILFLCEDNGIGISVDTPAGWIEETYASQSQLRYFRAAGELDEIHAACRARSSTAAGRARRPSCTCRPRACGDTPAATSRRPTARSRRSRPSRSRTAAAHGAPAGRVRRGDAGRAARAGGGDARARPGRGGGDRAPAQAQHARAGAGAAGRLGRSGGARRGHGAGRRGATQRALGRSAARAGQEPGRRTLAAHVNHALHDEFLRRPELLLFGEDSGKKGGVYAVTQGLQKRFGIGRVFDTLLDETAILGIAQGAAHIGFLPLPEIQYLAYLHNALDQLRGEACSLSYFSNGQFQNPMVVRIQGLGYQKGFGGHFHNDNSIGALRDIPGLMLPCPRAATRPRGCCAERSRRPRPAGA